MKKYVVFRHRNLANNNRFNAPFTMDTDYDEDVEIIKTHHLKRLKGEIDYRVEFLSTYVIERLKKEVKVIAERIMQGDMEENEVAAAKDKIGVLQARIIKGGGELEAAFAWERVVRKKKKAEVQAKLHAQAVAWYYEVNKAPRK